MQLLRNILNKAWGSNAAGLGASVLGGIGEHKLIEHITGQDLSTIGDAGSIGLASGLNALFLTPWGRELLARGKGSTAAVNARRPLFGADRFKFTEHMDPKKVLGVVAPKVLATMSMPMLDAAYQSSGAFADAAKNLPGTTKHWEQASKKLENTVGHIDDTAAQLQGSAINIGLNAARASDDAASSVSQTRDFITRLQDTVGAMGESATQMAAPMGNMSRVLGVGGGAALGLGAGTLLAELAGGAPRNRQEQIQQSRRRTMLGLAGALAGGYAGHQIGSGAPLIPPGLLASIKSVFSNPA